MREMVKHNIKTDDSMGQIISPSLNVAEGGDKSVKSRVRRRRNYDYEFNSIITSL